MWNFILIGPRPGAQPTSTLTYNIKRLIRIFSEGGTQVTQKRGPFTYGRHAKIGNMKKALSI